MSRNLVVPHRIECDGVPGRWPCPEFFEASSVSSLAETRGDAAKEGWAVGVRNVRSHPRNRWRLDFCPKHAPYGVESR